MLIFPQPRWKLIARVIFAEKPRSRVASKQDATASTRSCKYLKPVRRSNASDMLSWSFRDGQDKNFGMRAAPTLSINSLVQLETQPSDTPNSAAVALTPAPCPSLYKPIAVRSHGWKDGPRPPSAARTSRVPYSSMTRAAKVGLLPSNLRHRASNDTESQREGFGVVCIRLSLSEKLIL